MRLKLGDFLVEVCEKTTQNNQYPVLTSSKNGIFLQEDYFTKSVASRDNTGYKVIRKGEFTYRSMSDTGLFFINCLECTDVGIVSPAYPVFKIKDDKVVLRKYLIYFFKSDIFNKKISLLSKGSTRLSLKFKDLKTVEIEIPSLEEQKTIVEKLEEVDRLIETFDARSGDLEELVSSKFKEWFGSFPEKEKVSSACKRVTDFVASGSFASLRENVKYYSEPKYAILVKTADFACNFESGLTYIDKHAYDFLRNSNLFGGELLLPNVGASIGKAFIVPKLNMPMSLAPNAIMLEAGDEYINEYLYCFFLSELGQKKLLEMTTATAMPKFNKTQLKEVEVIKAPLEEQLKFCDFYHEVKKAEAIALQQKEHASQLKRKLMEEYFE